METSAPTYAKIPSAPKIRFGCLQTESLTFSPGRYSTCWIFGSLDAAIRTASSNNATPITMYGIFTEAASCTRYRCSACGESWRNSSIASGTALRISSPPSFGAIVVPSELKACVRSNRLEAVAGLPRTTTYGFAATCRPVMPAARTMSAPRNSGNDAKDAAGRNKNAPTAMLSKPATMVF